MKGFGSYNDWPYYATPNSNLSAFATPFSVNRECIGYPNPMHSRSYGYDYLSDPIAELNSSIPSSNPYNGYSYSGSQALEPSGAQCPYTGQCSNSTKLSPVEAQPYFHSYASPAVHDHSSSSSVVPNHWSSFSGFTSLDGSSLDAFADKSPELGFTGQSANQFAEFNHAKGKSVGVGSSFSSNQPNITGSVVEERMNLGYQDIKDNHGGVPHMIDWVKHSVPTSADQLDDKSCWWSTVKPTPIEFSGTSVLQSSSLSLETHHEAPLKLAVDSGNHGFSYTGLYDKESRQQEEPSRADTVSSTPISGSVTDLNIGNIVADGDVGHNNFYNIKEAYPMPSPVAAGCFDLGHLRMHLERNEPSSSNNTMISDRNVSGDAVDYIHKARHGIQNPHLHLGSLGLRFSATEDVNSIEKSFGCGDLCNPAVDSPCWKGAPTAHIFHNESSEALPAEHVRKIEECFGSVIQEAQNFLSDRESNVKKSYDGSNSCQMYIGIVDQETSSAGSPRKFSETKFASEDCKSDDAVNAGRFQSEPSCDFGLQNLADVTEMKENSVPPTKPIDCESGSSHNEHQVIKENILVSQKSHTLCIGGDAGCNENECFESSTSLIAEHALSSPSSVADAHAPTTPEKSPEKVSTGKLNVQMLVDTMQNLSELLLNHCINDACELKERDSDILKSVISNLNTCVLNDAEQFSPAKKCLLHQLETSRCAGEPCELPQNELEANLHFGSGKPKLSDSISPRGDAEMTKAEKMTKALKKILGENFDDDEATESQTVLYKNLWLEAEAALCSVNYKARYNQMKIEMEKHSYKQSDVEDQSKDEVIPSLSKSHSSETQVHNNPNSDSSGQGSAVLDATNPKAVLKFSIDMNKPNPLEPEGDGRQDLNSFVQNYTVSGTNEEVAGNDEASVMARYHVLISRGSVIDLEKSSDIAADKLAASVIDNQNQVNFCQDSPIPGENKADYEASVLARFHILKSRVEDSSSLSSKEKWLDGAGSSGKGIEDTIITENASEGKSLDAHLNSYAAVDKSIPKEFHLDLEDQEELQPCRSYEFHLPSHLSDGFASDWEHV